MSQDTPGCTGCAWYKRQIYSLIFASKFTLALDMVRNRTAHRKQDQDPVKIAARKRRRQRRPFYPRGAL